MTEAATTKELLLVTIPEGTEFVPEVAFAASAARAMGLVPRIIATDFCTTEASFQSAVAGARPFGVVFFDAVEFREVISGLSDMAVKAGAARILVAGPSLGDPDCPPTYAAALRQVPSSSLSALASALDLPLPAGLGLETLPLDVEVYGGSGLLDRGVGCSLFGELDSAMLIAIRGPRRASSPCAALARLEGALEGGKRELLRPKTAFLPLEHFGPGVRRVEWLDRDFFEATVLHPSWSGTDAADRAYLAPLKERGLFQSVRVNARIPAPILDTLRELGVGRAVFDCDALEDRDKLPGADATARDVAAAVHSAHELGLEAGVLLVAGLPGETPEIMRRRCDRLRESRPERVRVVPFEPSGGAASAWCERRDLWPPRDLRWNRELFQPLRQPELGQDAFVRLYEIALAYAAETAVSS